MKPSVLCLVCTVLVATSIVGCESVVFAPEGSSLEESSGSFGGGGGADPDSPGSNGGEGEGDPSTPASKGEGWTPRPDLDPVSRPVPPRGGEVAGKPATLVQERLFSGSDEPVTYTPQRIWRLNGEQFKSIALSIAATGRVNGVSDPFGFTPSGASFNNYAGAFSVAESQLAGVLRSARNAVIKGLGDNKMPGCVRNAYRDARDETIPESERREFDQGCREAILDYGFQRLVGRQATEGETERLTSAMSDLVASLGVERGIVASWTLLFGVPDALFRREVGTTDGPDASVARLSAEELGTSLAYTLTERNPFAARISGVIDDESILDPAVRSETVDTLLSDRGYLSTFKGFILEYFKYDAGSSIQKDGSPASEWPQAFSRADKFVTYALHQDTNFIERLLSSTEFFEHDAGDVAEVMPETDSDRPGLLTRQAFLWSFSQNEHTDPIKRGHFIREHLLCQEIPEIPIDVIPQLPADDSLTIREKLAEHRSKTGCATCHNLMDPLGLPLEQFDHFGRYRSEEQVDNGTMVALDTSGEFMFTRTLDGPISGASELVETLATSQEVERCFIRHLFRFMVGRDETYGDAVTLEAAHNAYTASDGSLKATVKSIAMSDTFLFRAVEQGQ